MAMPRRLRPQTWAEFLATQRGVAHSGWADVRIRHVVYHLDAVGEDGKYVEEMKLPKVVLHAPGSRPGANLARNVKPRVARKLLKS